MERYRNRRLALSAAAVALAGLFAVPATAAASHAAASQTTSCPWVTSAAPVAQRVAQLMGQRHLAPGSFTVGQAMQALPGPRPRDLELRQDPEGAGT